MCSEPDDITLKRAELNGLIAARDAVSHQIAIAAAKLDRAIEEKQNKARNELCEN